MCRITTKDQVLNLSLILIERSLIERAIAIVRYQADTNANSIGEDGNPRACITKKPGEMGIKAGGIVERTNGRSNKRAQCRCSQKDTNSYDGDNIDSQPAMPLQPTTERSTVFVPKPYERLAQEYNQSITVL